MHNGEEDSWACLPLEWSCGEVCGGIQMCGMVAGIKRHGVMIQSGIDDIIHLQEKSLSRLA